MSSATTVGSQSSAYLMQSGAVHLLKGRTIKFGGRTGFEMAPTMVSDQSSIYPEAVVASSQALGWQKLRALEMRHTISEWTMPPLENHCILVHLGRSLQVAARIGEQSFEQSLEPGTITIIPAGLPMHWRQEDATPNHTLQLYLDPQFLRGTAEFIDVDYSQISIAPQFGIRDEHLHHLGMSLLRELKDANVSGRHYADSLAEVFAMQLVRRCSYLNDLRTSRDGMAPRKLRSAIEFINQNLDQEQTVTLAALAEKVQMSYFHFSRAFKQSTGAGPSAYMTKQRIQRAKKLLAETDLPIADIASRTGFASQSHFTTTFRRLVWNTPKAFREMQSA